MVCNKTRIFLLTGLCLSALGIGLIHTGVIHFYPDSLTAQYEIKPILLHRGDITIAIPKDEWITAQMMDQTYIGGKYKMRNDEKLVIEMLDFRWVKKNDLRYHPVQIDQIHTLYHGEKNRMGHHFIMGLKSGGIITVGLGLLGGIRCTLVTPRNSPAIDYLNHFWRGFVIYSAYIGRFAIPGSIAFNLMGGTLSEILTKEYPLTGQNKWTIIPDYNAVQPN